MNLIIERDKWLRGDLESWLLRPRDGKMCCLGFLGKACGYTNDELRGVGIPADTGDVSKWPVVLQTHNNKTGSDLININDSTSIPEHVRENQLTEIFASIGIEVEFV